MVSGAKDINTNHSCAKAIGTNRAFGLSPSPGLLTVIISVKMT